MDEGWLHPSFPRLSTVTPSLALGPMNPSRSKTVLERYAEAVPLPPVTAVPSLLDEVLAATNAAPASPTVAAPPARGELERFLAEPDVAEALKTWIGGLVPEHWRAELKRKITQKLSSDIAQIDGLVSDQINAILHHPEFQKLEASWRGLKYLVDQVPEEANVKIRVLNASWKDMVRDQERALEFDQSHLFRKVYNEEFGTPGGEPFGMLIGNYEMAHRAFTNHPTDDMATLRGISAVAAASFAPFIAATDPRFLEVDSFTELEQPYDLSRLFSQADYLKWRSFRDTEDARFVGLVLPRVVYRAPYGDDPARAESFRFTEDVSAPDRSGYLWGNAAFAFAAVAVRAFSETSWLADIRGTRPGADSAGLVTGLPAIGYGTGSAEFPRSVTDAHFTDIREKELSDLGFVPLCHSPGSAEAAFFTAPSASKPKIYSESSATANAKLSAMLQYMLCASRFAHYLKVIIRDQVGGYTTASEIEERLQKWVMPYVSSNDNASQEVKARYPLREAKVSVRDNPEKPGQYQCSIYLRPHFQLDQLSAGIRLSTQLNTRSAE